MSYDTDRYGLKKQPNQSLSLVECGIQICHPGHAAPLLTYHTYSAHFILEGKGIYTRNDKSYTLGPGEGFMITPGTSCVYVADTEDPWKYVYASFCGGDSDALVHSAGLDEENVIFSFPLDEPMIHDIYAMHAAGKCNEAKGYDVVGYFLLCMSRLVKANLAKAEKGFLSESHIKRAYLYIEEHYADSIQIADVASHIGLDRTYLYRLFQKYASCSPSRYLLNFRLDRAAQLLEDSTVPVCEVGLRVGFHDASHFYKAFSGKYGMTPKMYRQTKHTDMNL